METDVTSARLGRVATLSAVLLTPRTLFVLVALGLVLRLLILISSEHRLDCDESTVALMALEILERRDLPFFFHGSSYNGGGAFEAYLGAAAYAVVGVAPLLLKLCVLGVWTVTALLFADLCRRALTPRRAVLAVLFFCVATPFFLEWSVKARGGFGEVVLVSVLLLWLAAPPAVLRRRPTLQCAGFGLAAGFGLWTSEMLLPMLPCAGAWLLLRRPRGERGRAALALALSGGVGLLPLLHYNLTHDWAHLQQSILYSMIRPVAHQPLSPTHLLVSARFALGSSWWLLLFGLAVGAMRLVRERERWGLGQVLLVHAVLYLLAYWITGLRYLAIPPSRVLYALAPGLAVLLAHAPGLSRDAGALGRSISAAAIASWLALVSLSVAQWVAAGAPREAGSWRGSWCLIDGGGLYRHLRDQGVEIAYVSYWTASPLALSSRIAARRNPEAPRLRASPTLPVRPPAGRSVAFALHSGSLLLEQVELSLRAQGVGFRRSEWEALVVLSGLDSARVRRGRGLPALLAKGAWPRPPATPDGFN